MPDVELKTRQTHQELWELIGGIYELSFVRNVYINLQNTESPKVSYAAEKNHSQYASPGRESSEWVLSGIKTLL